MIAPPDNPLFVFESVTGVVARLHLTGELDLATGNEMITHGARHLDNPEIWHVIADLSGVAFIGSSGLTALITLRRRADAHGKLFSVEHPRAMVAHVIEVTGLTRYLTDPTYHPPPAGQHR